MPICPGIDNAMAVFAMCHVQADRLIFDCPIMPIRAADTVTDTTVCPLLVALLKPLHVLVLIMHRVCRDSRKLYI